MFKVIASTSASLFVMIVCGGTWLNAAGPVASKMPPLLLGVAWYPEQWLPNRYPGRWDVDLSLMEKAHIRFVRIGEFAWSTMEPSEGNYNFAWLDQAIADAARHHIYVVLGTPSAAPPAWLTGKYPETLRIKADGMPDQHGNRDQFDFASSTYREFTRDIATKMAERYGHNPDVIGWQIDNEYGNESYSPDVKVQFHAWLKAHYHTLANLNTRWATAYWSQTYMDWSQIPIETTKGNPGLLLCWKHFVSDTWRSYQAVQIKAIRAHTMPSQFITTNFIRSDENGLFDNYDHYIVGRDLDLISWDFYVDKGNLDPIRDGTAHDMMRGILHKNFWVMETQPGLVAGRMTDNSLDKGEVRAMAWFDIAHGADAVSYWQWRSATNGQEEYDGTLLGTDGTPVPVYNEIEQIGREFERIGPVLAGTSVHSQVAILYSYDSNWALKWQLPGLWNATNDIQAYYRPLHELAQSVDIIDPTADLSRYKLVVAPALNVITPQIAQNLVAYVRSGGHLVLGQHSGMKTEDNGLQPERQPGPLASLLGGRVEQYYALRKPISVDGKFGAGDSSLYAEQLSTLDPSTHVLARYGKSNGWLDSQPAIITRAVGKGSITYIGIWPNKKLLYTITQWMLKISGVHPLFGPVPKGVDVNVRSGDDKSIVFLINLAHEAKLCNFHKPFQDVLSGGEISQALIRPYGIAILLRSKGEQ